jgi:hypothetical protein
MKKSEALEIISNELKTIGVAGLDEVYAMNKILEKLEDAGMIPPSYEGCMRDGKKYVRELHGHYDTMLVRNRWEPEDV